MLAKLPLASGKGYTSVEVEPLGTEEGIPLWGLLKEHSDGPGRGVYVIVNDMLFDIGGQGEIEREVKRGGFPKGEAAMISALQNSFRHSNAFMATHRLLWEALDLPMEELQAKVDALRAAKEDREKRIESIRADSERKTREFEKKRMAEYAAKVTGGEKINGSDLLDLARHIGVEVHPRTAGVLKKNMSISDKEAVYFGSASKSTDVFAAYRQVRAKLEEGK